VRKSREFHEKAPLWMRKFFKERNIIWRKPFLTDAPILIAMFGRKTASYFVQSIWLSIGYLILALEERGLASLTYTPSKVRWINELLKSTKGVYSSNHNTCRKIFREERNEGKIRPKRDTVFQ